MGVGGRVGAGVLVGPIVGVGLGGLVGAGGGGVTGALVGGITTMVGARVGVVYSFSSSLIIFSTSFFSELGSSTTTYFFVNGFGSYSLNVKKPEKYIADPMTIIRISRVATEPRCEE